MELSCAVRAGNPEGWKIEIGKGKFGLSRQMSLSEGFCHP